MMKFIVYNMLEKKEIKCSICHNSRYVNSNHYKNILEGKCDNRCRKCMISGNTLKNYIRLYGEINGSIKWENYKSNISKNTNIRKTYERKYDLLENPEISKEEYIKLCLDKHYKRKEYFIKEFGEEKGLKEYNNNKASKNIKGVGSLKYYIDKYGEEEGSRKYNVRIQHTKIKKTLETFIERYGLEEGTIKYNNYREKLKQRSFKRSLPYLIETYGKEEGTKIYKEKYTVSLNLDRFIKRYGKENGTLKYNKWLNNVRKNLDNLTNLKNYSKIANKLFEQLLPYLDKEKVKTHVCNKEYYFLSSKNKKIYLDFVYENKNIEFYGDYWHANPKIYLKDSELNIMGKKVKAKNIWKKDKLKLNEIKKLGFKTLIIWEKDFRNNNEEIVNKCLNFLGINNEKN